MGKVHGSLARAGKVKGQTPKVAQTSEQTNETGRVKMRSKFNKRYAALKTGQDPLRVKINSVERQMEMKKFKEAQVARLDAKKKKIATL